MSLVKARNSHKVLLLFRNPVLTGSVLVFVVFWLYSGFATTNFLNWLLENTLTLPGLITFGFFYSRYSLSDKSIISVFLFLLLHLYGSQYTYQENPIGQWLLEAFNLQRNHYDRIVHFSFGLLMALPMYEICRHHLKSAKWLPYLIPLELTLSMSVFFELIEWVFATLFVQEKASVYLGMQGDMWDAQKDVMVAFLGALFAVLGIWLTTQNSDR
jgi:putative membrane protein